jgi:hypothetical protein
MWQYAVEGGKEGRVFTGLLPHLAACYRVLPHTVFFGGRNTAEIWAGE